MSEDRLRIDHLTIADGTVRDRVILDDITLHMAPGDVLGLHGPNASGKSSLIRAVAGFIPIRSGKNHRIAWGDERRWATGRIFLDGHDVSQLSPSERRVALVPQNLALYPDKTVVGNLAFPLISRGATVSEARRRALEMAEWLDLADVVDRRPSHISGGQQQRVAIGRALIATPRLVLLDEPLASLDALSKHEVLGLIGSVLRERKASAIYVTHDPEEASVLCDVVAFVQDGKLHQVSTPREAYREPATIFVARMFSGFKNILEGTLSGDGRFVPINCSGGWHVGTVEGRPNADEAEHVYLAARPEALEASAPADSCPAGTVIDSHTMHGTDYVRVAFASGLTVSALRDSALAPGAIVGIRLCKGTDDVRIFGRDGRLLNWSASHF